MVCATRLLATTYNVSARRSITWQEAVQMAQACKLPRASDRSSSHAAIASDTSSATFANSAQSFKTTSNNCAITTPCAPGHIGNPRRRHKYSSGLHAFQGNWRAAIPGNAVDPPSYLWNFDPITGASRIKLPNTQTPNPSIIFGEYQRAPFAAQKTPVFGNLMQPRPNQHRPRPQF